MDRIRNEYIKGSAHNRFFGDKVMDGFEHAQRRDSDFMTLATGNHEYAEYSLSVFCEFFFFSCASECFLKAFWDILWGLSQQNHVLWCDRKRRRLKQRHQIYPRSLPPLTADATVLPCISS